ncbi:Os07g0256000 [Oryza sativa Japonica Group]|uniref:Os07g0256000 protein n=2 Tax=Oryza TaxID=4527 RepID=A0A0P0X4I1_ORYSJ|nr:Os07g0256000 [Oryza sativa Japonica Group]
MANDEYDALHAAANARGGTVGCPCALPSYGFCHGRGFSDFRGVRLTCYQHILGYGSSTAGIDPPRRLILDRWETSSSSCADRVVESHSANPSPSRQYMAVNDDDVLQIDAITNGGGRSLDGGSALSHVCREIKAPGSHHWW